MVFCEGRRNNFPKLPGGLCGLEQAAPGRKKFSHYRFIFIPSTAEES